MRKMMRNLVWSAVTLLAMASCGGDKAANGGKEDSPVEGELGLLAARSREEVCMGRLHS